MPTTEANPAVAEPATGAVCAVCPHPQDSHDPIGLRYCSVTAEHGLDRGCVCVSSHKPLQRWP
jgi:hypothetical protein